MPEQGGRPRGVAAATAVHQPLALLVLLALHVFLAGGGRTATAQEHASVNGIPSPSIATSLPDKGDPGGLRRWLSGNGVTYGFIYTSEAISSLSGGLRHGTIFEGLLEAYVQADLDKLFGLHGLSFFSNSFQIHGQGGPGRTLVGNVITISDIEALPSTRLSELWLEQKLFDDKLWLRAGQLAVDTEFLVSEYFKLFISRDWPSIVSEALPSGGPAYPLSTPGVRVKINPTTETSLLVALFNGDPAGPGNGDPELRDRYGLKFRVRDPPFLIAEAQYRYNHEQSATGLAGGIKLGAWHQFGRFDDQRFGFDGLSLEDPSGVGIANRLPGDSGLYAVFDQQLYRPSGGDARSGVLMFSRAAWAPPDRNRIDYYLDGGIVFSGLLPGRPKDAFGAIGIFSHVSNRATALDLDRNFFSEIPQPVRDYEASIEITYAAEIVPGWTIRPDLQVIIHPNEHSRSPYNPPGLAPIRDATLIGLRSTIIY